MTHDDAQALLGAYALDAVDGDERDELELHLLSCARCRAEVAEHREVAALLGNGGAAAPPGVWDRIAGSLDDAPPRLELAPVVPLARRRVWPRALAAAAVVAVVALLGAELHHQATRIDHLQTALASPLDDPAARPFRLATTDGAVVLQGAVGRDGVAHLVAAALPRLDRDRTYQLWGKVGDRLVSLGLLGSDPTLVTFRVGTATQLAITAEVAGGVVQSANQPVVAGALA